MIKPRNISGLADYSEAENAALSVWMREIEETFLRYGFSRFFPRPLELREVLLAQGGVQKQIFGVSRIQNDAATDMALPFDRTVPLAHWVALNAHDVVFPYKRYDISYSYRGERAQAGRYQAFFQADVDIVGMETLDLTADAECIAVIYEALDRLQLGPFSMRLNHMGLAKALLEEHELTGDKQAEALILLDKLERAGKEQVTKDLETQLQLSRERVSALVEQFQYQGTVPGFLSQHPALSPTATSALDELQTVLSALSSLGIPTERISFCPGIVRGLNYYSGVVFESFIAGLDSIGSIASGGRYDDLVSTFSNLKLPGVGGSIGLTRLFAAARKQELVKLSRRCETEVFAGFRTPELALLAGQAARQLREQSIRVDLYPAQGKAKKQMSYADRKGIPVMLMVMDANSIVVKDMRAGTQVDVPTLDAAIREAAALVAKLRAGV